MSGLSAGSTASSLCITSASGAGHNGEMSTAKDDRMRASMTDTGGAVLPMLPQLEPVASTPPADATEDAVAGAAGHR